MIIKNQPLLGPTIHACDVQPQHVSAFQSLLSIMQQATARSSQLNIYELNTALLLGAATTAKQQFSNHKFLKAFIDYVESKTAEHFLQINTHILKLNAALSQITELIHPALFEREEFAATLKSFLWSWFGLHAASLYSPTLSWQAYCSYAKFLEIIFAKPSPFVMPAERYVPKSSLKIGIVTPDLCRHSLAQVVLPVLIEAIELAPQHEWYAYYTRAHSDEETLKFKKHFKAFYHVHHMSDIEIAKQIYKDGIDILLDISGATDSSRLSVFMLKPTPVAVAWGSGMMTPIGFLCLPYFITDSTLNEAKLIDKVAHPLYLSSAYCYKPDDSYYLQLDPLFNLDKKVKALYNSEVIFSCFNNPIKLHKQVIETWAEILRRLPKATLLLRVNSKTSETVVYDIMASCGVRNVVQRITFVPYTENHRFLMDQYYNKVHIALDPWPCTGCLTTAEALWFAVPVITYYQDMPITRQSLTALRAVKAFETCAASTVSAYVENAVTLATNPELYVSVVTSLRKHMPVSALMNYRLLATEFIQALETAWGMEVAKYTSPAPKEHAP